MPPTPKYCVVFERDMQNPVYIYAPTWQEFIQQLNELVLQRGPIELMYRVY